MNVLLLCLTLANPRVAIFSCRMSTPKIIIEQRMITADGKMCPPSAKSVTSIAKAIDMAVLSPDARKLCILAHGASPGNQSIIYICDAASMKISDPLILAKQVSLIEWDKANQLLIRGSDRRGQSLLVTVEGIKLSNRRYVPLRPAFPLDRAQMASDVVERMKLRRPQAYTGSDFSPLLFDYHQGDALVSPSGDSIVVSANDPKSATGAQVAYLTKHNNDWGRTRLGNESNPKFTWYGNFLITRDWVAKRYECKVYSLRTAKHLGTFLGDAVDVGPMPKIL